MGISTVANPHFLNVLNKEVLLLVKGDVNKKVLMPNLIKDFADRLDERGNLSKGFSAQPRKGVDLDTPTGPRLCPNDQPERARMP